MIRNHCIQLISILLLVFVSGCGRQKPMTVAQVLENAASLDGQTLRVRGRANIQSAPSQEEIAAAGGCANTKQGTTEGWLTLYDPLTQDRDHLENPPGIKIAASSFHCEGDNCQITCSPFQVASHETYEFSGTLRVNGEAEIILENIDLEQSRQFIDGEWKPIAAGTFEVTFP